jgi:hypothetical protein
VDLACGQSERERVSQRVDNHMDFRGQAAARAAWLSNFLNDEGYAGEEIERPIQDIDQVSRFIADLKGLRLDEAKSQ